MSGSGWSSNLLDPFVIQTLQDHRIFEKDISFLDVGCGKGKWGFLIRSSMRKPTTTIGLDRSRENMENAKERSSYDSVILADARYLPFKDESFDLLTCFDVLELVNKEEGEQVLLECNRVAKTNLMISVPNRSRLNIHKGKWTPKELKRLGWTVRGVGFSPVGAPVPPGLSTSLTALCYYLPDLSRWLLAWKNKNKN